LTFPAGAKHARQFEENPSFLAKSVTENALQLAKLRHLPWNLWKNSVLIYDVY
jgi:hypothetical protein